MGNVPKTYEDLKAFIVRDQFIDSCNEDLAMFIREKKPKDSKELVELSEIFLSAHGGEVSAKKSSNIRSQRREEKKVDPEKKEFKPLSERVCYNCNEVGHIAKDCVKDQKKDEKKCYLCNKKGHIAKDCRQLLLGRQISAACVERRSKSSSPRRSPTQDSDEVLPDIQPVCPVHGCVCKDVPTGLVVFDEVSGDVKSAEVNGADFSDANVKVVEGFANGQPAQTLRDNGCGEVVVRKSLVKSAQYTGRFRRCHLIDGSVQIHPTAVVNLDSPYFTGRREAVVMPNPLFDVVIGNVPGSRTAEDPKRNWQAQHVPVIVQSVQFKKNGLFQRCWRTRGGSPPPYQWYREQNTVAS